MLLKLESFGSSFGLIGAIELQVILEADSYGACLRWQLARKDSTTLSGKLI